MREFKLPVNWTSENGKNTSALFYFISFEVLKIRYFDAKRIAFFWF